jgi:hypothetical protein
MNFEEWVQKQHSDFEIDEGWKNWAKKATVGGALLGAGLGLSQSFKSSPTQVPTAATQQEMPINTPSTGSPEYKAAYQRIYKQVYPRYERIFGAAKAKEMAHDKASLAAKAELVKASGRTSGTFEKGELIPQSNRAGKIIMPQSTTSPDAGDFL